MTEHELRAALADCFTVRDHFAAAALTGLLAGDPDVMAVLSSAAMSDCAYNLADAMLARRDQPAPAPLSSAPSQAAGGPQTQPQPQ